MTDRAAKIDRRDALLHRLDLEVPLAHVLEVLGRAEEHVDEHPEVRDDQRDEHREKPFFSELVEFITSGPTWALVVEGEGAIATMRATIGATDPANAAPGTIRGDLASSMPDNLVHGSDSTESAEREIALWFGD